jgi:hypothetical protein
MGRSMIIRHIIKDGVKGDSPSERGLPGKFRAPCHRDGNIRTFFWTGLEPRRRAGPNPVTAGLAKTSGSGAGFYEHPSCLRMPRASMLTHSSATLPSATLLIVIPSILKHSPLDGISGKSFT